MMTTSDVLLVAGMAATAMLAGTFTAQNTGAVHVSVQCLQLSCPLLPPPTVTD